MHENQTLAQGSSALIKQALEQAALSSQSSLHPKSSGMNYSYSPQLSAHAAVQYDDTHLPIISKFYGIIIRMFFHPTLNARFHALYGQWELVVSLSPLKVLDGTAPERVSEMVLEWAADHHQELMTNWERCKKGMVLKRIPPLS